MDSQVPEVGQVIKVRQRLYLVDHVISPPHPSDSLLVKLSCVDDDAQGQPLENYNETLRPKYALRNLDGERKCIPMQVSPLSLVEIEGSSKRLKRPRSLTVEEFQTLMICLREPYATMAALCACFGLRISECLALKWSDVDWPSGLLHVQRGIVDQVVDTVKTERSAQTLTIANEVLALMKIWKQATEFPADSDWIFASPIQLGRLPYSYTGITRELNRAAAQAGIGHISSHVFRHSYRTWADSIGTPLGIQQRLMRHSDIRTTMSYGTAMLSDLKEANGKIAHLALVSSGSC